MSHKNIKNIHKEIQKFPYNKDIRILVICNKARDFTHQQALIAVEFKDYFIQFKKKNRLVLIGSYCTGKIEFLFCTIESTQKIEAMQREYTLRLNN